MLARDQVEFSPAGVNSSCANCLERSRLPGPTDVPADADGHAGKAGMASNGVASDASAGAS